MATVSRIDKILGLFCRISSLLWGSFAKETCNFIDPTNCSHPMYENVLSNGSFDNVFQVLETDLCIPKETYIPKETCMYPERPIIEICIYENIIRNVSFGVVFSGTECLYIKRDVSIPKETYYINLYIRESHQQWLFWCCFPGTECLSTSGKFVTS